LFTSVFDIVLPEAGTRRDADADPAAPRPSMSAAANERIALRMRVMMLPPFQIVGASVPS